MRLPIINRGSVLNRIERGTRATIFSTESVPHHGNRVHGEFRIAVLALDGNDSPVPSLRIVKVQIGGGDVGREGGVFRIDLLPRVQYDVQPSGRRDWLGRVEELSAIEPARQYW